MKHSEFKTISRKFTLASLLALAILTPSIRSNPIQPSPPKTTTSICIPNTEVENYSTEQVS